MCLREIVYLSRFCDRDVQDVGNIIALRYEDLLSIPKLSLYIVKGSLILKSKCNIFESIVYPSPTPSNYTSQDSSQLVYQYNYNHSYNCNYHYNFITITYEWTD